MSEVKTQTLRNRIVERLCGSEKVNILVVGTSEIDQAAFINSMEMSVTGRWPNLDGSTGGDRDTAGCLSSFEMFSREDDLSGKVACLGLCLHDEEEKDIPALVSLVLQGRGLADNHVSDMSKTELEKKFTGVHIGLEIDTVVFVCSGEDPVPVKVMESVKRGVDSAKTCGNIPLFLFMTKQNDKPSNSMNENKQKAQTALGISESDSIQLYHHVGSKVCQKDAIDRPLLMFWDKILNHRIRSRQAKRWDLKHFPQYLATIFDGVPLHRVVLLSCFIHFVFSIIAVSIIVFAVQGIKVPSSFEGNCKMHTSILDRRLAQKLQETVHTNSRSIDNLNSNLKFEIQNMTSEIQNTLNTDFDEKLREMKSDIQHTTSELQNTLNATFDEKLQEMKLEMQNRTFELVNTLNSSFHERLHEMKSEVLAILNSALSNQTTNFTNDLNRTLGNFEVHMNNTLEETHTKLDDQSVVFSKTMNESTEILNNTFSTLMKTFNETSSELNGTWERGLLSLQKEAESIALKLSTELDKKQATFDGKLESRFGMWEIKQNEMIRKMEIKIQYWQAQFNKTVGIAESKLLNTTLNLESTVAVLNTSIGGITEVQKEPIQQDNESVMTRAMILCEQYSLQILVAVAFCVVIWLFCSRYKRELYQRRQLTRRRGGQAPGTWPRPYGDAVSDDEEWLDEKHEVFIIASLDWTLDEVERCVRTAVQGERGLTNPDIRTLRISGQDDIDVLNRRLQRNTRVICCANSTTRNILLSDTEHDEISYVVKAAEKIVGGSGVMVLLYGHEKSRDIQQLYDNMSFDRAFLNKQTRLLNKAHRDNLFFSVFKSLNETQKHRLCDWICGNT